ncbi:hypothetical protein JGU66_26860 [Myxococcaceae bacterium JPH2]|nr:hypothetical protein [Myxococcaceae bacterium JPH2]
MRKFMGALLLLGCMTACGGVEEAPAADAVVGTQGAEIKATETCATKPELCPGDTQCCIINRGYDYRCVAPTESCPLP